MALEPYTYTCEWEACHRVNTKRVNVKRSLPRFCGHVCWFAYRAKYRTIARKYTFTEAQNALIREAARTFGALKRLWAQGAFGAIPYAICKRQTRLLGIVRTQRDEVWTPEEEALLAAWAGRYCLETMAKKLAQRGYHRTSNSIQARLYTLGYQTRQGDWSLRDIAQGLDIDEHSVKRWVERGYLMATPTAGPDKPRWYVTSADLKRFLVAYPYLAAHGDMRLVWVITLMAGDAALDRALMRD